MARDPAKAKARKASAEITPKQRMNYVTIRIAEVSAELEKLRAERKVLREKVSAMRATKKGGEE